jgi:hypothetical protein
MSGIAKAIPSHLKPSAALRSGDNGEDASKRHHGKTQSHVVSSFPMSKAQFLGKTSEQQQEISSCHELEARPDHIHYLGTCLAINSSTPPF